MKTDRHHIRLIIFLLIFFSIVIFSCNVFAAEEGEEAQRVEDEKMTKEGQAALVAASEALQVEDFATAEKTLEDYLATNPTYKPEILYQMLGSTYFNQEKFSEGAKMFAEAFELFPENSDFLTNQTVCTIYYAQNNDDKKSFIAAAKLFEKQYEVLPEKDMENLRNAALCYYQGDDLESAKGAFLRLYEMKSEPDMEILDTVYKICQELGQKDEMKKYLLMMMDLNPLRREYWLLLGEMYQENSDYLNLASALEVACTIELKEKNELNNLVSLYNYLNVPYRTAKKLVDISGKIDLNRDDELMIINGYYSTNRVDKAASYINGLSKKDANLMMQRANMLLEARENEEAIKAADEIISSYPDQGNAYMIKGYAAWDMEDWDLAKKCFEKASGFKDIKSTAKYLVEVIQSLEEAKADVAYAREEVKASKEGNTAFTTSQ